MCIGHKQMADHPRDPGPPLVVPLDLEQMHVEVEVGLQALGVHAREAPQVALYPRAQVVHQGHLLEVDGVADDASSSSSSLTRTLWVRSFSWTSVAPFAMLVFIALLCAPRTACRARTRRRPAPCGRRCRPRCRASASRGRACGPRHSLSRGRCRLCRSRRSRRSPEDDSVLVAVHGRRRGGGATPRRSGGRCGTSPRRRPVALPTASA